ncbi:MAG TPA: non-homologous end-joining DNA ligase [Pyrinomonadaceae bacterium]|jgi:bifunctional non-homologous end joining protein LigD
MSLETYWQKRDFSQTPEPKGKVSRADKHRFVCQEHHASSLHFDFRLEIGGVLKSWSIRKGPSLNPQIRRLAVPTEDHPVEYLEFQGTIPEGNYGAGEHMIWDSGTFKLLEGESAEEQFEKGKLKFELQGKKLKGAFSFFKLGSRDQWLLAKSRDARADENWKLELLMPDEAGNKFIEETEKKPRRTYKPAPKRSENEAVVKTPAKTKKGEKLPTLAAVLKTANAKGAHRAKVGEYVLDLTNPDKVYWTEEGYTKADLIRYYYEISDYILPYLEKRPLIMKRYPNGIAGYAFHQHDVDEVPEYVETIALVAEDEDGKGGEHTVDYIVGENVQTLLYMANLGAIERHPWHSRVDKLDFPDWFVFDLDPGEAVEFETICDVALATREIIKNLGLQSYAKTSGSRGIHVYVPIKAEYSYEQVGNLAERIAKIIARENPATATAERSKQKREKTQIYVDFLQNAYGKSVVAPYSVRPKPGAPVSAPLEWEEVEKKKISIKDFTIRNMLARVRQKGDLFKIVLGNKQGLEEAFEKAKVKAKKTK